MNKEECSLTNKQFSDKIHVSEKSVERIINNLENIGLITRENMFVTGSRSTRKRILTVKDDMVYNLSHSDYVPDDGLYTVYIHTNKINNKSYVGITCKDVEQRWKNGMGYKDNNMFFEDIIKYGWDNFDHAILHTGLAKKEALRFESLYIDKLKTTDKNFGYNRKP